MMHDIGLGPPVEVERYPNAKHTGPCFDGVYGCHRCWNAGDDGEGTLFTCDWCKAENVHTIITRSIEEPVLYAVCHPCRAHQQAALAQELAEEEARYGHLYRRDYDEEDE